MYSKTSMFFCFFCLSGNQGQNGDCADNKAIKGLTALVSLYTTAYHCHVTHGLLALQENLSNLLQTLKIHKQTKHYN